MSIKINRWTSTYTIKEEVGLSQGTKALVVMIDQQAEFSAVLSTIETILQKGYTYKPSSKKELRDDDMQLKKLAREFAFSVVPKVYANAQDELVVRELNPIEAQNCRNRMGQFTRINTIFLLKEAIRSSNLTEDFFKKQSLSSLFNIGEVLSQKTPPKALKSQKVKRARELLTKLLMQKVRELGIALPQKISIPNLFSCLDSILPR